MGILSGKSLSRQEIVGTGTMALKTWQIVLIVVGGLIGLFVVGNLVLGAIMYFGVMKPDRMLPEKCTLSEIGLKCLNHSMRPDKMVLVLGNDLGRDIFIDDILVMESIGPESMSRHSCLFDSSTGDGGLPFGNGRIVTITSDSCDVSKVKRGERYRYEVGIFYHIQDDSVKRVATGEIYTTVE